jgi:tetratricopeptide (TPR) repeat protein
MDCKRGAHPRRLDGVSIMKSRQKNGRGSKGWLSAASVIWLSVLLMFLSNAVAQTQAPARPAESPQMRQVHQALALAERGDAAAAMNIVRGLLEQNQKFVPALKLEGMLLEESGRGAEAGQVFEQGLQFAPNDPDLLLKTGIYKLAQHHLDDAIKLLEHCARLQPGDGDTQFYLAQAYHLQGKDALALAAIRRSVKASPDNPSVVQKYGELLSSSGDYQEGLRWLLKAQKADSTLPHLDYEIGLADFKLMDVDGAAANLAKDVQAHPDDVAALDLLAEAQLKLTHWPEAKDAFARLAALKPGDATVLLGLGHCQVEMQDFQAAVDTLNQALRLNPTLLLAHFYLARAYAGLGNADEAQHQAALHRLMMDQESFVRAEESNQRESAIKPQARQLLTDAREDDVLKLYRERFKGSSATDADAYVFIGKLYLFMGKTDDGLRCLHHALALDPSVRGAHTYEGILKLKQGELDKAESDFKADLANDPNYQTAIAEMGEIRYRQSRWQEAADLLAKSRTMTPELLYMLCDAYFHLGKTADAALNAEATAAYGRNDPQLMNDLLDLLRRNGQSALADSLAANAKP